MSRRSFYFGLGSGVVIMALAMLIVAIESAYSPPASVPATQFPISATPASWQLIPRRTPNLPPGSVPFEFNGQTYYVVPLNSQV